LIVSKTNVRERQLLWVPEYRVMSFSAADRVRWVEHIACIWEGLEMCARFRSKDLIGRPILVDLGHRWDFSRTALNLKVEGC